MLTFDDAVIAWVRKNRPDVLDGYETAEVVTVEHSAGYGDDSTWWPASTTVRLRRTKHGRTGQVHRNTTEVEVGSDAIEFARELFALGGAPQDA